MSLFSSGRKPVFIAEDDDDIAELIVTRLEIAGYSTAHARDGASALQRIKSDLPAAVILDINMPRMDGFEVLRGLRNFAPCSRTPVLMLTARKSAEDVRRARVLGADDYLAKPFDGPQFLLRVERLLRARSPRPAPAAPLDPSRRLDA